MLSIHEPNIVAPILVEFDVSINFMGMAIGSQGANITAARTLDGIKDIVLDETTRNQGFCKFKIYANNPEAAERARNMLEISQQQKLVPQGRVGQVIGKQGKTIQDIVDKSGVLRVQIGDENPEQGMVPLTFTGTREALMYAELMVDFQLKHISEMDAIRLEDEEIRRKLYMSRSTPYNHYGNNTEKSIQPYQRNRSDGHTRAINGGDGNDRRSMGGSGYRGGAVAGYRPGMTGQRAGGGTGRYHAGQNTGTNFGGNRFLGRSGGLKGRGGQSNRFQQSNRDAQQSVDGEDGSPPLEQKKVSTQNRQDSEDSKSVEDSSYNGALSSTEHSDKTSNKQNSANNPHKGGYGGSSSRSTVSTSVNPPARNRRNKADEE
ncbi:hypothetical protein Mgra_00009160 [Meloidogyne graminicola]|nr:hypothetical protein Mgra_00009160 [Meloidogyne graminicola]